MTGVLMRLLACGLARADSVAYSIRVNRVGDKSICCWDHRATRRRQTPNKAALGMGYGLQKVV